MRLRLLASDVYSLSAITLSRAMVNSSVLPSLAEDEEHELTLHDMPLGSSSVSSVSVNNGTSAKPQTGRVVGGRDSDQDSGPHGQQSDHEADHPIMGQMEGLKIH